MFQSAADVDAVCAELDAHWARTLTLRTQAAALPADPLAVPWPVFCSYTRVLNPQSWGSRFENYFRNLHGWERVPSNQQQGDVTVNGKFFEVKTTFAHPQTAAVNFVQLRPGQELDGYHLFVIEDSNKLVHLELNDDQMRNELVASKAAMAHGAAADRTPKSELAIRFRWHGEQRERWIDSYRCICPADGAVCNMHLPTRRR